MKACIFFLSLFLAGSMALATTTGSPIADNPTLVDPFAIKQTTREQTVTGVVNREPLNSANKAMQSSGFNSRTSMGSVVGTDPSSTGSIVSDTSAAAGVTTATMNQAKLGDTGGIESPTAQADIISTNAAAGIVPITITVRYKITWNETFSSFKPGGPVPVVINTPYSVGNLVAGDSPLVPPVKVAAAFAAAKVNDVSSLLSTKLSAVRMFPIPGSIHNGLRVEWPCGIDVSTGVDTCCGISKSNLNFMISKGTGIADDLDKAGIGDALLMNASGVPLTTFKDADAISRVLFCRYTTSMDKVIAGSTKIMAQGIPQ